MTFGLRAPWRLDGPSKSFTWPARGLWAAAGSVIAGVLMASPAAAAGTPVPPNTTNSATAATGAKGLSALDLRKDQKIVRAVVRDDGTLVAGQSFGASSATRVENPVGTYQVCFDVPVTNGTYVASIGIPGNSGVSAPGEITVVGRAGTDNCLYIQTFDSTGVLADRSFHVVVVYTKKRD
ncbi:hypothetical protein GCM10010251_86330 [Streptomyces aurantiogriseus]|uniref:Uncharacterized protein n=2 Tax=Streptomyces aurantiogriseus TaxID=66870 RepID=A0A918KZD2_9ACTN|nr:hypothetical protein GCM10010251_86330 [Streptomyces aurantiogriseus]